MNFGKFKVTFSYAGTSTGCVLYAPDKSDTVLAASLVKLYYKDRYDREKGRRYALRRAMQNLGLSKEERTHVWERYNATKPGGRWKSYTSLSEQLVDQPHAEL